MDYSIFDGLMDHSVIVVNDNMEVIYGNEEAAVLCESSVRRMSKSKPLSNFITFKNTDLVLNGGDLGKEAALPMMEVLAHTKSEKEVKAQLTMQPFSDGSQGTHYILMMRTVTLEEVLQGKYREQLEAKEVVISELEQARSELEKYSKNLEKMVEERTAEINKANQMLQAIMNSLGQGFVVFDQEGVCSNIYTKACEWILESQPEGQNIWDVLSLDADDKEQFKKWMQAVYSQSLPFDTLKSLAPEKYDHSEDKFITLNYFDIEEEGKTSNIVLVATDKTVEHRTQKALEEEKEYAKMILKLVANKQHFEQFLASTDARFQELSLHFKNSKIEEIDFHHIFRELHTVEGEAGAFSLLEVRLQSRECQSLIEPFRLDPPQFDQERYKDFLHSFEKLEKSYKSFLEKNKSVFESLGIGSGHKVEVSLKKLQSLISDLERQGVSSKLCGQFLSELRKKPLKALMRHFDDVVQLVAEKQGKQVLPIDFETHEIHVDPDFMDGLLSALVHAFRNAVDHGLEPSEEREFVGKPPEGSIQVKAQTEELNKQKWLKLLICDDGQGIDPGVIRRKVIENNPDLDVENLSDQEVIQFIFRPGFSSREEVGEFSGRGVGMDAVRYEVKKMGGEIHVSSTPGEGTVLSIKVPLESLPVNMPLSA